MERSCSGPTPLLLLSMERVQYHELRNFLVETIKVIEIKCFLNKKAGVLTIKSSVLKTFQCAF